MIVAAVADRIPERVRHLVYLDSDVLEDGDTSAPSSGLDARRQRAVEEGNGWCVPSLPDYFPSQLAGLPPETVDWFLARLSHHPLRTWLEPIHLTGAATVPVTSIRCTVGYDLEDEDTRWQDDRIRSETLWRYREIDAPHMALITHPALVADLLIAAAESGPSG